MLVYDRVSWYLPTCPDIISFSLGKEKKRVIGKWLTAMTSLWYAFGVVPLTLELLHEFYSLYLDYITGKENPHPVNLIDYYSPRLDADMLYFSFIRDSSGSLLAWAIMAHKTIKGRNTLMLSFRAALLWYAFQKLHLGNYIEYLFFDLWLSLGVDRYSRGRDRNGYGLLGSDIGVCIHKLQLHFIPSIANHAIELTIDESDIRNTTLFFVDNNRSLTFSSMVLYLNPKEKTNWKSIDLINLAQKRWFTIDVREIL